MLLLNVVVQAMVLASLCREGEVLPPTLPSGVLSAAKSGLPISSLPPVPPAAQGSMPLGGGDHSAPPTMSHPAPPTMSLTASSHGLIYPHAATPPLVSTPPLVPLAMPIVPTPPPLLPSDWIVTPDIKAKYDTFFEGIDKDRDGIVSGEEVRSLFMASNVPQLVLFHIWSVVLPHVSSFCFFLKSISQTGTCAISQRVGNLTQNSLH